MVDRQTRMKTKKFRRTPGSTVSIQYTRDKKSYAECAVTGERLHGTGHQGKNLVGKQSRSEKRPSVKFGGVLSGNARKELWENFALVEAGKKAVNAVPSKFRKFIYPKSAEKVEEDSQDDLSSPEGAKTGRSLPRSRLGGASK